MILYFAAVLTIGFFIGRWYMQYQITNAAKHNKVIAISGDLYTTKKTDSIHTHTKEIIL